MSPTRVDSAYEPNALPNVPKDVFGCTLKFLTKKKSTLKLHMVQKFDGLFGVYDITINFYLRKGSKTATPSNRKRLKNSKNLT